MGNSKRWVRGCIITIGVLAILVVIVAVIANSGGTGRPVCISLSMRAYIQNGTALVVHNDDAFFWRDIKMILDGKDGVLNGYELRHRLIAPGGELVFPLREFISSEGVRYNSEAWKPRTIYVSATVPSDASMALSEENSVCGSALGRWE